VVKPRLEKMLSILYVTSNVGYGGGEANLIALTSALQKKGIFPLVAIPGEGELSIGLAQKGVSWTTIPWSRFSSIAGVVPLIPLKTLVTLKKIVKENHISLVHSYHYEALKVAGLVARLCGIPSIWTCHGVWFGRKGIWGRYVDTIVDRVICVSNFVRICLHTYSSISPNKFTVVYNGVEEDVFVPQAGENSKQISPFATDSNVVIGMISRIDAIKRHDLFLRALHLVAEQFPNVKGIIVGGCEQTDELSKYQDFVRSLAKELRMQSRIEFWGYRRDMLPVYDAIDILILPSDEEAFPLVLLEAMARRKPVVSTLCGGPEEIVLNGETGFLVPKGNYEALSKAILSLCVDFGLRKRFGEAGYVRARQYFTADIMAERIMDVYREVLGH